MDEYSEKPRIQIAQDAPKTLASGIRAVTLTKENIVAKSHAEKSEARHESGALS